ncbi:MAG: DUF1456 family protein [Fibrobacteria bacterium]|nr:DUF1456 family protein [Fibrobacteria bacterium]
MKCIETLRRVRKALDLQPEDLHRIFSIADQVLEPDLLQEILKPVEEETSDSGSSEILAAFLEGLIVDRRGPGPRDPQAALAQRVALDNSDILKKLRIALDMRHNEVVATLARVGANPTKTDVASWFRAKGHAQYRVASDSVLRYFLEGYRPPRRPRLPKTAFGA